MFKVDPKLTKHFKGYCSSPEAIMIFVYMKCRFYLRYRDLEEMMSIRGASVDHATLQRWVKRFVSLIETRVRKRKKAVGAGSVAFRNDSSYGIVCLKSMTHATFRNVVSKRDRTAKPNTVLNNNSCILFLYL